MEWWRAAKIYNEERLTVKTIERKRKRDREKAGMCVFCARNVLFSAMKFDDISNGAV